MAAAGTVNDQDQAFMVQLLKAYKFEAESATTQAAKGQAIQKADELRTNAKAMGIDLSAYGPNVLLANTPGGRVIDWGLLSSTGKAWAGLNPVDDVTKWKQSVGTGLVSNLSGYQADFASFADSAAYDMIGGKMTIPKPAAISKPPIAGAPPVISGSNVGQAVTVPDVVTPVTPAEETVVPPLEGAGGPPTVGQTADVVRGGARTSGTQAVSTPADYTTAEDSNPDVLDAVEGMATNNDMLSAFFKDNPDLAGTDYTQWDTPTRNRFKNWADLYVEKVTTQGIIDQGNAYDPTKDPLWSAYEPLLIARDNMTKASLKTALDLKVNAINGMAADVKANYDFQIAEIQNALNMANWASSQQLAASGVIMVGQLSMALQANEAQGINKIWVSVQERTNGLNKLAEDINILRQDYADQGTLIDQKTILEIATKRLELIQGNSKEVQAAKLAMLGIDAQIAALNIAAPSAQKAETAEIAQTTKEKNMQLAAWTAELAQSGITITQNADGTWDWEAGLSFEQKEARNQYLFDQWYKTEGLKLDQAQLSATVAFNQFQEWATREGIKLDWANFGWQKTVDQYAMDNPSGGTGGTGGSSTDTSKPYMTDEAGFKADMQIANNPNEVGTNNYQNAVLRIGLGSGGLLSTDDAFIAAMNGIPKENINLMGRLKKAVGGNVILDQGMIGALTVTTEDAIDGLCAIVDDKDGLRALELKVAWKLRHLPAGTSAPSAATINQLISVYALEEANDRGYTKDEMNIAVSWLLANWTKFVTVAK